MSAKQLYHILLSFCLLFWN